jgi:hypothetical protein
VSVSFDPESEGAGMGVWGYQVFDGDGACDFLGHVIRHLREVVEEGLELGQSKRRTRYRKAKLVKGRSLGLHGPVAPAVAALRALLAGIPSARVCLGRKRVRGWKRAFLAWYEAEYVPANGPTARYRKNVEAEFDELARLAHREDPDGEGGG